MAKKSFLKQYLIKPENIIEMQNASFIDCKKTWFNMTKRVERDKDSGYFIIYVLAGHGIQKDGA